MVTTLEVNGEAPDVEPSDTGRASEEDDREKTACPEDSLVAHVTVKDATPLVEETPECS